MRRAAGGLLVGIALWMASLAWGGFIALRTVLDPDRSREVADSLYDDPAVRAQLEANVARAVRASLPDEVPVTEAELEAAAAVALDSPAVRGLVTDAFVDTHAAFLGEGEAPSELDAGAFGSAARSAVVGARPELDGVLPPAPQLPVALPTERIPDLGWLRTALEAAVPVLALAATGLAVLALAVTSDRPRVVRRASWWAIVAGAIWLAVAFGGPPLAEAVFPDQSAVLGALIGALAGSMAPPSLVLCGAGILGLALSRLWRSSGARPSRPAPRHAAPGASPTGRVPSPASAPVAPARRGAPAPGSASAAPHRPEAASTGAWQMPDGPVPADRPSVTTPPPEPPVGSNRRWVDGVGWVQDAGDESVPDGSRWVPGVGYVLDDPDG